MTILDAQNLILNYLINKNSFSIKENFVDLIKISETKELDYLILEEALVRLEKNDIIKRFAYKDGDKEKESWVLSKALNLYEQNVVLSSGTVRAINDLMNEMAEDLGQDFLKVNVLNVTEKDIQNLLLILEDILISNKKKKK